MGRATVYMRKKAPASPKHKYIPLLARFRAQGTVKPPRFKAHQPTGASCHTVNLASLCPNSPKQHSQPSSLLFLSLSPCHPMPTSHPRPHPAIYLLCLPTCTCSPVLILALKWRKNLGLILTRAGFGFVKAYGLWSPRCTDLQLFCTI